MEKSGQRKSIDGNWKFHDTMNESQSHLCSLRYVLTFYFPPNLFYLMVLIRVKLRRKYIIFENNAFASFLIFMRVF